jgi:hypothetical protein
MMQATQLAVLAKTGNPRQKAAANKILPIRKHGHQLLVTLLLANMVCFRSSCLTAKTYIDHLWLIPIQICNETLPIVSDGVLGGGVYAVIISTVLIVMCVMSQPSRGRASVSC